ncbi:MAG: glycosyltransferase family 4 protein [Xanthobacteraceae bacterium]
MRILMLAQFYPPIIGGEERHVRNLSAALARRGHDVSIATLAAADAPSMEIDQGVKIHRLRGTLQRGEFLYSESTRRHAPPFPDPELLIGLGRILADEKPEIVHAHNWLLHSFLPMKRQSRARLVVTLHDYSLVCATKNAMHNGAMCSGPGLAKCLACACQHYGPFKGGVTAIANNLSRRLECRAVDTFLAVSRAVASVNGLADLKVPFEVVPNFVPDDVAAANGATSELLQRLPRDGFLLFVGDLRRAKGMHNLLDAYGKLRDAPPLVLIGRRCPDTPVQLPPNVVLLESWPHDAIMQAWRRCLFGLAPSQWAEPCATVVMEAMACGKPVIGTDIGGMPDLIDHERTGLLVPTGDADALAAAMQTLIASPELMARMSQAALARVESLKAGSVVPRIEQIYTRLLASRGSVERDREEASHAA